LGKKLPVISLKTVSGMKKLVWGGDYLPTIYKYLFRDSEIGCPDAQDGFRNVLGNLIARIRLSVGKLIFLHYRIEFRKYH
jgi:hypothetical protein